MTSCRPGNAMEMHSSTRKKKDTGDVNSKQPIFSAACKALKKVPIKVLAN
jgi:hypothetical protein